MARSVSETDDSRETNWAKVYTLFLVHTNLSYDEIGERSLRQLTEIMEELPEQVKIYSVIPPAFGMGGNGPEVKSEPKTTDKPPKLSEIAELCGAFSGVK